MTDTIITRRAFDPLTPAELLSCAQNGWLNADPTLAYPVQMHPADLDKNGKSGLRPDYIRNEIIRLVTHNIWTAYGNLIDGKDPNARFLFRTGAQLQLRILRAKLAEYKTTRGNYYKVQDQIRIYEFVLELALSLKFESDNI